MTQITQLIDKRKNVNYQLKRRVSDQNNKEVYLIHDRWENYCKSLPPAMFLSLDCMVTTLPKRFFSRSSSYVFAGFSDQMYKTHPNHKPFFHLFHLFLLEWNYNVRERPADISNFYFTCQRALRNNDGQYHLFKVTSHPYSISTDGRVVDFVSWYMPIKIYEGEPFASEIEQMKVRPDTCFDYFKDILRQSKNEMLHYLQFTSRQKEVLRLMAAGYSKGDIAKAMDISIRTVEKYNQQILSKGQDIFVLNRFQTAYDVVDYLSRMDIL